MRNYGSVADHVNISQRFADSGYGLRTPGLFGPSIIEREAIPSKIERDFVLKVGLPDSEFGREIIVRARSSLEAGLYVLQQKLIPDSYVAHSLVDQGPKPFYKGM